MSRSADANGLLERARALGCPLQHDQAERLVAYLEAMLFESRTVSLTGVRDPQAALCLHVLDSVAIRLLDLEATPRCAIDLGTGNGFPGVVVRILWPDARVILVDRTEKKLRAIERALSRSGVEGVEARHVDARQIPALHPDLCQAADLITARAIGAPATVGSLAAPLMGKDAVLALWLADQTAAPKRLDGGLRLARTTSYSLPAPPWCSTGSTRPEPRRPESERRSPTRTPWGAVRHAVPTKPVSFIAISKPPTSCFAPTAQRSSRISGSRVLSRVTPLPPAPT